MLKQVIQLCSKLDNNNVIIFAYNNKMIKLIILLAAYTKIKKLLMRND